MCCVRCNLYTLRCVFLKCRTLVLNLLDGNRLQLLTGSKAVNYGFGWQSSMRNFGAAVIRSHGHGISGDRNVTGCVALYAGWYLHLRAVGGTRHRRFLTWKRWFLCILCAFRCLFYTHKFTSNCTFYMLFWGFVSSWSRIKHSINCE